MFKQTRLVVRYVTDKRFILVYTIWKPSKQLRYLLRKACSQTIHLQGHISQKIGSCILWKCIFTEIWKIVTQSGCDDFAYVVVADVSQLVKILWADIIIKPQIRVKSFSQDLDHELKNCLWNGPRRVSWVAARLLFAWHSEKESQKS